MSIFCAIDHNSQVENFIVAESKAIAESVTNRVCIEKPNDNILIGWNYNSELNKFYSPEPPFASWVFNETTSDWEAPTPRPEDENFYIWSEENLAWELSAE